MIITSRLALGQARGLYRAPKRPNEARKKQRALHYEHFESMFERKLEELYGADDVRENI